MNGRLFFVVLYTQNTCIYTKEPLPGIDLDCNEACDSIRQWTDLGSASKLPIDLISYGISHLMAPKPSSVHRLWFS